MKSVFFGRKLTVYRRWNSSRWYGLKWNKLESPHCVNLSSVNNRGSAVVPPEPIVFICGCGHDAKQYEKLVEKLNYPHGVMLMDLRGESFQEKAENYIRTMKDLRLERAWIVGVDVGGLIAYQAAHLDMLSVSGIVLINSNVYDPELYQEFFPDEPILKSKFLSPVDLYKLRHPVGLITSDKSTQEKPFFSTEVASVFKENQPVLYQYHSKSSHPELFTNEQDITEMSNLITTLINRFDVYEQIRKEYEIIKSHDV